MSRIFPKDVIPETARAWKQRKRREWKAVMKAAETFLHGAAYTPADEEPTIFYPDIYKKLKLVKDVLSVKNWGR